MLSADFINFVAESEPKTTANHMHADNRREQLYRAALKLFLTRHYESVTIADIEKESGMTRGAVSYYSKTKLVLFKQVVRHYLIDKQNVRNKYNHDQPTFYDFINAAVDGVRDTMASMQRLIDEIMPQNASRSYLFLLLQLKTYFPDLHNEYLKNRNNELSMWNVKIIEAIARGELRSDLDVMTSAEQYVYLYYGESFYESMLSGLDAEHLRRVLLALYGLMKAPEKAV